MRVCCSLRKGGGLGDAPADGWEGQRANIRVVRAIFSGATEDASGGGPERTQVRLLARGCGEAAIERRCTGLETAAAVQHVVQVHYRLREQERCQLPGESPGRIPRRHDGRVTSGSHRREACRFGGRAPATSLRRSGSVPYLAFDPRRLRSCDGCPVADGVLSLTHAAPQPLRVEVQLRCDPAERQGCVVVGAEPGEGVIPIGLPGGGADGIEQRAFQYSGH